MAVLSDLLSKNPKDMTDEELEEYINQLKKIRVDEKDVTGNTRKSKTHVSNEEKRIQDLLSTLTPEEQAELLANWNKGEEEDDD
jgi:high-affinity K+ transport system ATPase subunit B